MEHTGLTLHQAIMGYLNGAKQIKNLQQKHQR